MLFPLYESQSPHPFDLAQGRLCRKKRDKGGAPSGLFCLDECGS